MPKSVGLTAAKVLKTSRAGYYGDGGGLYLQVSRSGTKSWVFRYRLNGHTSRNGKPLSREMGLGSASTPRKRGRAIETFSLAEARVRAREKRQLVADGIDPIEQRRAKDAASDEAAGKLVTFRQAAEAYMARPKKPWRNAKHKAQWKATLETYAYPVLGRISVAAIDEPLVLRVLEPIWETKTETASRVRGRIKTVLDAAKVRKQRAGENPAAWAGNLEHLLGAPRHIKAAKNHSALPYAELPAFISELGNHRGNSAKALEFLILTAARTNEVIGARWPEFDRVERLWIVPASRMKAGREHIVPLTDRAVAVLSAVQANGNGGEFIFPGQDGKSPLSNMAMLELLRGMRPEMTVHGFRSTFRDWAGDETDFERQTIEFALAHGITDKTEAAYRRSTAVKKRRALMEAWAAFACRKAERAAA